MEKNEAKVKIEKEKTKRVDKYQTIVSWFVIGVMGFVFALFLIITFWLFLLT